MRLIRTGHQREPPPRAASVPRGAGILSGRSLATFAETCVIVDSIVGRRQGYWESANWAIAGRFRPYGRRSVQRSSAASVTAFSEWPLYPRQRQTLGGKSRSKN